MVMKMETLVVFHRKFEILIHIYIVTVIDKSIFFIEISWVYVIVSVIYFSYL